MITKYGYILKWFLIQLLVYCTEIRNLYVYKHFFKFYQVLSSIVKHNYFQITVFLAETIKNCLLYRLA